MKQLSLNTDKWTWISVDIASAQDISSLPTLPTAGHKWVESLKREETSNLEMETTKEQTAAMWGAFIYHQNIKVRQKQNILNYYLTDNLLITSKLDFSAFYELPEQQLIEKMQQADNAIEGFMLLVGEIVASFLQDIDVFENRMHNLLWRIKEKNDENVFDQMMNNRHEILVWKNLIVPIFEIREAIPEAFGDAAAEGEQFKRTRRRINRCRQLILDYNEEIGEMIDLEDVLSAHRGNEIVKTLTVITMLFTPVAAFGALWGMNFEVMPELNWTYGYLFAIFVILISTWALYYYLKKKNWIGSLLKNLKDDEP
ncbi:magnesium transporter CorA family protein [Planococcus salinus]|uniref:Mg2+ transporter protein, CorA-like protein n=1 Tax=Planococcus salinus TaxID=1848460 RepID=A0A3M8P699_9BACL|nr:magnesium transporter CorA family protein [Planococcus salinus]RNF39197.1 hypothetical protein EEX84_10890 [Planococcus salinus]